MSHPQAIKSLTPGRVVILDTDKHTNCLGIILQAGPASSKEKSYMTLILSEQSKWLADKSEPSSGGVSHSEPSGGVDRTLPRPVLGSELFHPDGPCGHQVIQLRIQDISVITTKTLKVSADKIIDDFKKRQIPRFRNDPPGQSASTATQELLRLVEGNPGGLPGLDPLNDLHLRDMELVDKFVILRHMEEALKGYKCIHEPNFHESFVKMRDHMKLKEQAENLKFLMSDASLQLLPEYQQRMDVLHELQYIDKANTVQLKGRVACEISNQELIITELVFENVLTALHPTEIAAVLSSVVFEMKRCSEPNLTPDLVQAKEKFISVARRIGETQKLCGLKIPVEDYVEEFHFGLMEVVFEWARGMPFSEITELTDVQEGIIVRCIQRLDEVIKDVRNAARIIGDPILYQKMEESSNMIKRDIVFAASLYTQ